MRNEIFAVLCLIAGSMPSLAAGQKKPNDKVILTVNATVHATAQKSKNPDSASELNDELTCQLIETVEYKIVGDDGKRLSLERTSHKNHLRVAGAGAQVNNTGEIENWQKWTYSIAPESSFPNSNIAGIDSHQPYAVRISLGDFFADCNGKVSGGQDKGATGWDANGPIYKIVPYEPTVSHAILAAHFAFQSIEDWQMAAKGQMNALSKKLQTNYTPRRAGGFFASGNATRSYEHVDGGIAMSSTVEVHYTVQCGEGPDENEVFVEPETAYATWLPTGNLENAEQAGNTLKVRVSVHKKGDPGKPGRAKIVFNLMDVSMEKGVCLNWPRKTAKSDHGLKFIQNENKDLNVAKPEEANTKDYVETTQATLSAFDFGAWGTLRVTAQDEQGRDLKVHVRGQDTSDLSIPLDENHNHIADAWETQWAGGLRGQETDDEDAEPEGKRGCPGDGLSLYEEYRGFRVQGGHVRTDPKKKDLFLCDNTTGKVAAAGMDLFERATKLKVWRMTYAEMGSDRLINRNGVGAVAHVVDQHGILIEDGPNGIDPQQVPIFKKAPFGPPVLTLFVQLPPGRSYDSGDDQADVAHELCHAVGLCHHGDENYYAAEWYWELTSGGAWQLYEQGITTKVVQTARDKTTTQWVPVDDRKPIQAFYELNGRPFRQGDPPPPGSKTVSVDRWRLQIAGVQSPFCGDQECLMRYADKQAYLAKKAPDHVRYLPDEGQWKMRSRLCADKKGTGVNGETHRPQSRYGDAVEGNCRSQVVINDKYAK